MKLVGPSISLFLSFLVKKSIFFLFFFLSGKAYYIKCLRSRRDAMGSLCLPKINTKMPTRTKSVEMNKVVTNSEIYLHHFLCKTRGFKIGRSSHRRRLIKKVFLKLLQNLQENICVRVRHSFYPVSFTKFLRTFFFTELFRVTAFDE